MSDEINPFLNESSPEVEIPTTEDEQVASELEVTPEGKKEVPTSDEYNRLMEIYRATSSESVSEALATVLMSTNTVFTAGKMAAQVMHQQGKERRLIARYDLASGWLDEENRIDEYLDDLFITNMTQLLNRYVVLVRKQGNEYKMKALIVFLTARKLYDLLHEIDFDELEESWVTKVTTEILSLKDDLVDELTELFEASNMPEHAAVMSKNGLAVLSIEVGTSIAKYFANLQEPSSLELHEALLERKSKFLRLDKGQLNIVLDVIELKPRTWRTKRGEIVEELRELASESEMSSLNELILNF